MATGVLVSIYGSVLQYYISLTPYCPYLSLLQVSEYPVILSIENHCSVDQQRVMAQHLKHILGDKLLKGMLDSRAPVGLPTPEELKGKILLKAKKIGGLEESFNGTVEDSLTGEVSEEDEVAEIDEDNLYRESIRRRVKVGLLIASVSVSYTQTAYYTV
ncbi:hypothetical protein GOODEAATRI_013368 [Goodea atripinnis]|uniref:Phosphatidylinositol-specific phospholipase C X domain-containing protein n=1 Tax=Goodea atripinnis TaxID=208336 RepID=A0ABV0N123_9TELE